MESLFFFGMHVYKFVKLSPFGNVANLFPDDPWYAKLITHHYAKSDETFYNKMKLKSLNKNR